MMIEDWEAGTLFWKMVDQGASHKEAAEKVRDKFLYGLCGSDKETYFYVGTILAHPATWLVLGVFYPKIKRKKPQQSSEPSLFSLPDEEN